MLSFEWDKKILKQTYPKSPGWMLLRYVWNYEHTYIGLIYFIIIIMWDGICDDKIYGFVTTTRDTKMRKTKTKTKTLPSTIHKYWWCRFYLLFLPLFSYFIFNLLFYFYYFWFIDFIPVWILNVYWNTLDWTTFPRMVVLLG